MSAGRELSSPAVDPQRTFEGFLSGRSASVAHVFKSKSDWLDALKAVRHAPVARGIAREGTAAHEDVRWVSADHDAVRPSAFFTARDGPARTQASNLLIC